MREYDVRLVIRTNDPEDEAERGEPYYGDEEMGRMISAWIGRALDDRDDSPYVYWGEVVLRDPKAGGSCMTGVRYTSLEAPPDNGCGDCAALKSTRAFCQAHRSGRPCTWCGGRGFRVQENRWVRCES